MIREFDNSDFNDSKLYGAMYPIAYTSPVVSELIEAIGSGVTFGFSFYDVFNEIDYDIGDNIKLCIKRARYMGFIFKNLDK